MSLPNNTDKFPNIFVAILSQSLAQGGSETEISLSSIRSLDGQNMSTSDFQFLGRGVLSVDVQSAQRAEFISFTGIDTVAKQCTGAKRGLSFKDDTVRPQNKKFHAVGAPVIIAFGTHNLIDIENLLGDAGPLLTGITRLTTDPSFVVGNPTISIANPAVITLASHDLTQGDQVVFTTTGSLPTGIVAGATYYVLGTGLSANTFEISKALTGDPVITSGSQSGTHTLTRITPYAIAWNDPAIIGLNNGQIFVDSDDTTKGFISDKLNIHSSNNSVQITKTITNPSANEILDYDLKATGGSVSTFDQYQFDDGFTTVPAIGFFQYDNATPSAVTHVYVNNLDGLTVDHASEFSTFNVGDKINLADTTTPGAFATYIIVSITNGGAITDFAVTYDTSVSTFTNNDDVTITLIHVTTPGSGTSLAFTIHQVAHGLSVGNVIKVIGSNAFGKAQADVAVNSEAVGIVTVVIGLDDFTYVSSAIQMPTTVTGTPGDALFLDPTVAGGITTVKPTAVGQIIRGVGTLIDSGNIMYFDIAALAEEIVNSATGGSQSAANITEFDDFIRSSGSDDGINSVFISKNFYWDSVTGPNVSLIDGELDHPGIIEIANPNSADGHFYGFTGNNGTNSELTFDNDFDITILSRIVSISAPGGTDVTRLFFNFGSSPSLGVNFTEANGIDVVNYNIGAGDVATLATFPTSGDWFQVRFIWASGVLTISLDSTILYTGSPALSGVTSLDFYGSSVNAGAIVADVDFVQTTYATNRTSPVFGGGGTDVQVFDTPGTFTWNKPVGAKSVQVITVGAGGGGGSGYGFYGTGGSGQNGTGGGGGAITTITLDASIVGSTESIVVGQGGAGGPQAVNGGSGFGFGTVGADGTPSSFGSWLQAGNGGGGDLGRSSGPQTSGAGGGSVSGANLDVAGVPASIGNGLSGQGVPGSFNADFGGAGGGTQNVDGGSSIWGGGAGGGGEANGGTTGAYTSGGGGAAGTSGISPTPGGNGKDNSVIKKGYAGEGGGGGGATTTLGQNGQDGGNGGFPGGGGGGGGRFLNAGGSTEHSGAGGNGGNGQVIVITFL